MSSRKCDGRGPMPIVNSLHLPRRQRLGLMMVFALGGLLVFPSFRSFSLLTAESICVTSILRMTTLESGSKAKDQIYETFTSTVWTTLEANTGIICACLPMLNGFLSRFFPRLCLQGTKGSTSRAEETIPHESKASPAKFGRWGRFGGEKPIPT